MARRKPIFLKFRSCNLYVMVTVSFSLFTDMIVYSIIIPIMPFIIDSIQKGKDLSSSSNVDLNHSTISNGESTSQETGVMLALFSVGLLVGSPILGFLADRMKHRQWLMVSGIAGLLGSTILFLFAKTYWELLLARLLQGFSDACVWTLGLCVIADTFPIEELGTQMGKVLSFHSLGLVAGSPIGALYKLGGYRAPFILCIVLAGVDLLLRLIMVERRNRPPEWFENETNASTTIVPSVTTNVDDEETGREENKDKVQKVTTLKLLRQHRLLAALLLAFANGLVVSLFEPTLPIRLSTEWGYDASQIGLIFLAWLIPTIVVSPIAGYISDKYGSKVVCCAGLFVSAISMFLIGIPSRSTAGGIIPLIVIFAFLGFSASSFVSPSLSEIAYVVKSLNSEGSDSGQGMSYALFNISFAVGALVGPLMGGYLYSSVGFFKMCIIGGCFIMGCIPYIYVFTGERGKFISRPEDRKIDKNKVDKEKNNSDTPVESNIQKDSSSHIDLTSQHKSHTANTTKEV